jgi:hypothetical protein
MCRTGKGYTEFQKDYRCHHREYDESRRWRDRFNVYCGKATWLQNEEGLENLARYIIRASFSQERMTHIAAGESVNGVAKVIDESKDGKTIKTFDALDWPRQRTANASTRTADRRYPEPWRTDGQILVLLF